MRQSAVNELCDVIEKRAAQSSSSPQRRLGGARLTANMMNAMPRDMQSEVLTQMVFDLFLEVEALRSMALNPRAGLIDIYAEAYRATALTSHCSTGPSDGWEKLLAEFYPSGYEEPSGSASGKQVWRESLLLKRLGFTPEELESFKQLAAEMELYT